jgi:hypothetical protein
MDVPGWLDVHAWSSGKRSGLGSQADHLLMVFVGVLLTQAREIKASTVLQRKLSQGVVLIAAMAATLLLSLPAQLHEWLINHL